MPLPLAPEPTALQTTPVNPPPIPAPSDLPPPFSGLASGDITAISLPPEKSNKPSSPLSQYVQANLPTLVAAGLDFFESKDQHSVFFNPVKISLEELQKADAKGDVLKLAPPVPEPKTERPKKAATLTVHGPAQPLAPDEAQQPQGALANQQVPMNPVPKPPGRIQAARLQALKTPNSDKPGNGPVDQLSKRAL